MTETYQFNPAVRSSGNLIVGVAGGTGSGKTMTAILLAAGMIRGDGRIAAIDTEEGRMLEYAPRTDGVEAPGLEGVIFDRLALSPPFRPDCYDEALLAARAHAGPDGAVIVDSMSHSHEGEGGYLEWHDDITTENARKWNCTPDKASYGSWGIPKAARNRFYRTLARRDSPPTILTFRAAEKTRPATGTKRFEIEHLGLQPIGDPALPFMCSVFMMMEPMHPGIPTFTHKALSGTMLAEGVFPRSGDGYQIITKEHGARLRLWADGGTSPVPETPPVSETYVIMSPDGTEYVRALDGYLKHWNALALKCKQADDMTSLREWHRTNAKAMAIYATNEPGIAELQMVIEDALNAPAEEPDTQLTTEQPEEEDELT